MRFVDRSRVPVPKQVFSPPYREAGRKLQNYLALDEKERAQTRVPDRRLPETPPILPELLTLFDGKCAFCEEARSDLMPFRFRPPNGIDAPDLHDAHIYYAWMSDLWQNLYPICPDCYPTDHQAFPVDGTRMPIPSVEEYFEITMQNALDPELVRAERAVFLDPCADDPLGRDLVIGAADVLAGQLGGLTPRGTATIQHFNLNRPDLVQRRFAALDAAFRNAERDPDWRPEPTQDFLASITFMLDEARSGQAGRTMQELLVESGIPFSQLGVDAALKEAAAGAPEPAHTSARLTHIAIDSFKALSSVSLALPGPPDPDTAAALLILGENATGKSSLLEAVALAAIPDAARDRLGEKAERYLLDPRFMGVDWMAQRSTSEVRLTYSFGGSGPHASETERVMTVTPGGFFVTGPDMQTLPVFAYGAYRHYKSVQRAWREDRPVRSLFHSDDLLSNPEKWLLTLEEEYFDMVVRALRVVMGGGFRIIQREAARCLVVVEEDGVSLRTPLDTVSSGFRTILALTCDMMRWLMERYDFTTLEAARALVLIDEVEAHLHPRWKVSIMSGLRRAFPAMTFIVTTHDPLCLRGMRDGEVMVLQRVPGQTRDTDLPVFVDTLRELPDVTKLTIEQLLTSDLFDLFDTDDPRTGHAMADLADALALRRAAGDAGTALPEEAQATLRRFRTEVQGALPVGSTEVARIVEEAVADYVLAARNARAARRRELREETKARIRRALSREAG
ncbi:AAA domain-containing protein, putative AbiEii toxin, Type IV TA system [Roseivivax lentus]|uniref:AAA domain-containing protein, putative AbiEii toxin, Type IV TA system n=1 Tax=Roseivivax lentus TaxID=633194 RepID=A0A1N7K5Z8_9RHOB|nr:AAA family ATPase [Roseivivax lentus]SIS57045.1 AAA domain-containing protein, putative AbiEii toxin, Type IV TA system [Roseivivax lentus]